MRAIILALAIAPLASADILWQDATTYELLDDSGDDGTDTTIFLDVPLSRDDTSEDTLYFRFTVTPFTDSTWENYFGGFQFYLQGQEHLGVGNSWGAYAWSTYIPDLDLNSAEPSDGVPWEFIEVGDTKTIVGRIQYAPGVPDFVTIWLNPTDAGEEDQPLELTTYMESDVSFDEVRLRLGTTDGLLWVFSDLAIADTFEDLVSGCAADFNGDGALNVLDFVAFQGAFVAQDPDADCDGNGLFNVLDFVCFQTLFSAGCP